MGTRTWTWQALLALALAGITAIGYLASRPSARHEAPERPQRRAGPGSVDDQNGRAGGVRTARPGAPRWDPFGAPEVAATGDPVSEPDPRDPSSGPEVAATGAPVDLPEDPYAPAEDRFTLNLRQQRDLSQMNPVQRREQTLRIIEMLRQRIDMVQKRIEEAEARGNIAAANGDRISLRRIQDGMAALERQLARLPPSRPEPEP